MGKKGASDKMMAKVPTEFEGVASTLKFKQRKVSAIRDFPPGCGRITTPNSRASELITVDCSSQDKNLLIDPFELENPLICGFPLKIQKPSSTLSF
ncbi:hypothetical protein J1N35_033881 [Gossypium stocksii]|uniref:Uncharacterized protein n=1 Tax=Gossypium stocksii TaxID=47602 RepID=A0A9D3UQY0_9ROSI|nr:hypothetical protein J1N35_033881 [Gossypium stocksii]